MNNQVITSVDLKLTKAVQQQVLAWVFLCEPMCEADVPAWRGVDQSIDGETTRRGCL